MKIPFSKDQIIDRMRFENPWWASGQTDDYYSDMKKREYFDLLFPLIKDKKIKRAVVLMGPRRVGKTVLLFQSVQALIEKGIPHGNICYLSIETPIYNGVGLEELLNYFLEATSNNAKADLYVFFDEIQYLKDWEVHLKSLVDSYHKIKFVVSGSAAAALRLKSDESGAGRFTDFILPPLTFHEYLSLKDLTSIIHEEEYNVGGKNYPAFATSNITELNKHFIDYINYGGYPEVSLSKEIQSDPGRHIRNDIIDKVLLRDLPSLYGIEDVQELNSLFTYIAYNTGCEMSLDKISQSSGVSKQTIRKYISYLEAAFLITIVHRIDHSGKKFKRANFFKIYLTNPSLRCASFSPIKEDDPFAGNLVETAIFSQWKHSSVPLYYARWTEGEVDIVSLSDKQQPSWAVEIKWSDKCYSHRAELQNIASFCLEHDIVKPKVTTYSISETVIIDSLAFEFIPASLYCYTVGRNLNSTKLERMK
jgi:predicted AAA+ superfamily ATPase